MKAIINCCRPSEAWLEKFFEGMNPYMLPVQGKPLIEFYFDYCVLSGINEILIVYDDFNDDFSNFISDGSRWGVKIICAPVPANSTRSNIILRNANFADTDIIYIDKFFFPFYNKSGKKFPAPSENSKRITLAGNAEHLPIFIDCREIEISTIGAYYQLNMDLLKNSANHLIMKGYSAEKDVYMGMNDVIMHDAELYPPVLIGDNVQIEVGANIGTNTIIGDTCIIDRNTHIQYSLVFDSTYLGADLDFDKKILVGNKIVDPINEVVVTFTDNFFSSTVSDTSAQKMLYRLAEIIGTSLIFIWLLPFYLLFVLIGKPTSVRTPISYSGSERKKNFCSIYLHKKTPKSTWFFKLCLDKFTMLKHVFSGKMSLIGDTPRDIIKDEQLIKRHKNYKAGVFTYADSLGHDDPYESLIDDLFYKHNCTFKNDMQIVLRTIVARLLKGYPRNGE